MEVTADAWAVDAACSGNPGPMEYQAIDLQTGQQVFHFGPMKGTNNIGEFLAIVHALALMQQQGLTHKTIYSDSYNYRRTPGRIPSSSGKPANGARYLQTSEGNKNQQV